MSKSPLQEEYEDDSFPLFELSLDKRFFKIERVDTADIDGELRFKDGHGTNLPKWVHFQLKSIGKLQNGCKYPCKKKVLEYLCDPDLSVPTILFVVDLSTLKVYWYYFDKKEIRKLGLDKEIKAKTLELTGREVIKEKSEDLNLNWLKFARSINREQIADSLEKIATDFRANISRCVALLYLLKTIEKTKAPKIFSEVLGIDSSEAVAIIGRLTKEGVFIETRHNYLLEDPEIGKETVEQFIDEVDMQRLHKTIEQDQKATLSVLSQEATVDDDATHKFLSHLGDSALSNIKKSRNCDDIYMELERLEKFAFRTPKAAIKAIKWILSIEKPLPVNKQTLEGYGVIEGKKHLDLLKKSIELLSSIRFQVPQEALDLLIKIDSIDALRDLVRKTLKTFSEYNYQALRAIGVGLQFKVLEAMEDWSNTKLKKHADIVLLLCHEFLETGLYAHESKDVDTMTITGIALRPTDSLKELRIRVLKLLAKTIDVLPDIESKRRVLKVLRQTSRTPTVGMYGDDLEQMIAEDTRWLLKYYIRNLHSFDNLLLKEIDEQKEWMIQRFGRSKLPEISSLKKKLNRNEDYKAFSILVGDDHGFSRRMKYGEIKKYRMKNIGKMIGNINENNKQEWITRILYIAKLADIEHRGELNYFRFFMSLLAEKYPDIAKELLDKHRNKISPFIINILFGLKMSGSIDAAKRKIESWINQGKHLHEAAIATKFFEELDESLAGKVLLKASEVGDIDAIKGVLESVSDRYDGSVNQKKLFIRAMKQLIELGDISWMHTIWYRSEKIIGDFPEKDLKIILSGLVSVDQVSSEIEFILQKITPDHPKLVIEYFKHRVDHENKLGMMATYSAVPYDKMWDLSEELREHKETVIKEIMKWYSNDNWIYEHRASELLNLIFEGSGVDIEDELIDLINTGNKRDADIVHSVLRSRGKGALLNRVTEAFIDKYYNDEYYRDTLLASMSETGVVTGEDGLLKSYIHKKDSLKKWKKHRSKNVRSFAENFDQKLDAMIENEKQRIDDQKKNRERGVE